MRLSGAPRRPIDPTRVTTAARASLQSASRAGDLLIEAYTAQILQSRLASTSRLSTHLGCVLDGSPQKLPAVDRLVERVQHLSPGRLVEAGGSVGGPVPLGPARRPAGLVPLEGPDVRGRAR